MEGPGGEAYAGLPGDRRALEGASSTGETLGRGRPGQPRPLGRQHLPLWHLSGRDPLAG